MFTIVKTKTLKDLQALQPEVKELQAERDESCATRLKDHYRLIDLQIQVACLELTAKNWRELYQRECMK